MSKRIAITSTSRDGLDSLLDPVFGRAAMFLIIDQDTREIEFEFDNPLAAESQGAGTGVAVLMKEKRVDAVISSRFGPKAYQALSALGIPMWNAPEGIQVKDALDLLERGELKRMKIERY